MVSDGGVAGTHPPSTLHFFVGDECVLIGVGSALISAPILQRGVLDAAGGPPEWSTEIPIVCCTAPPKF